MMRKSYDFFDKQVMSEYFANIIVWHTVTLTKSICQFLKLLSDRLCATSHHHIASKCNTLFFMYVFAMFQVLLPTNS